MGEPLPKKTHYTREEYLAFEEKAEYKSEYYDGEVFAMAGGSRNHSVICFNFIRRVGEILDNKDCVGFDSNMKLDISKANTYVYPDLMVICGDVQFVENRADIVANPMLIVEVLSPNTESFDRGKKFDYYRSLASLQEYVLVSQTEPLIEMFYKQNEKIWQYTVVRGVDEKVVLQTLQAEIALQDIYQKVVWEGELEKTQP